MRGRRFHCPGGGGGEDEESGGGAIAMLLVCLDFGKRLRCGSSSFQRRGVGFRASLYFLAPQVLPSVFRKFETDTDGKGHCTRGLHRVHKSLFASLRDAIQPKT